MAHAHWSRIMQTGANTKTCKAVWCCMDNSRSLSQTWFLWFHVWREGTQISSIEVFFLPIPPAPSCLKALAIVTGVWFELKWLGSSQHSTFDQWCFPIKLVIESICLLWLLQNPRRDQFKVWEATQHLKEGKGYLPTSSIIQRNSNDGLLAAKRQNECRHDKAANYSQSLYRKGA